MRWARPVEAIDASSTWLYDRRGLVGLIAVDRSASRRDGSSNHERADLARYPDPWSVRRSPFGHGRFRQGHRQRFSTKEVKRDIQRCGEVGHGFAKHDLKNQSMKTAGLESERTKDVERIVKLELRQEAIEKGQAEIKADATRNHRETLDAMTAWAKQFAESD
jgi:hypothetical protein